MAIQLYDSMARKKRPFEPLDPQNVRMYVCGPTVYDRAHIGNARPAVVFDVLFRLLRHTYGENHVTYVRNITDIDDKIIARARERGVPIDTVTNETAQWFQDDMAALGCLPPTHQPRATEYVAQMVAMIERLVTEGKAYAADGHVLFEVAKFPDYGRLSGRTTDDMIAGARVEVAPYKRDPMDFVLWKPSDADQPGWDSPWGRGRPGWHIECSAMARALLGESFDIHGGGADLMFPHHENEIAQSVCAHPGEGFARYWVHNGMVRVEGRKMSKSLGNFFTVQDKLKEGVPGEVIRLALLMTHYRAPLDLTAKLIEAGRKTLFKWRSVVADVAPSTPSTEFIDALSDDLNAPEAISILHKLSDNGDAPALRACGNLIGILNPEMGGWAKMPESIINKFRKIEEPVINSSLIDTMAKLNGNLDQIRQAAQIAQNFAIHVPKVYNEIKIMTDIVRQIDEALKPIRRVGATFEIFEQYREEIEFAAESTRLDRSLFDKVKSDKLIEKIKNRQEARSKGDFVTADQIKSDISQLGYDVVDSKEGPRWRVKE